ncbi:MAG: SpoIIE family protein phosphatase [Balneolaceae bacterium]
MEIDYPKEEIISKADAAFQSWQYSSNDLLKKANLTSSTEVLDSLLKKWGKKEFRIKMKEHPHLQKILYKWNVQEFNSANDNRLDVRFGLNTMGEIVDVNISTELIREQRPLNRNAVRHVFENQVDDYRRGLEDSIITGLVDYQHLNTANDSNSKAAEIIERLRGLRGGLSGEMYSMENIWNLTDFYLNRTVWGQLNVQRDSVELQEEDGIRFARSYLSYSDSATGVTASLTVEVLPAGSLKSLNVELGPEVITNDDAGNILQTIALLLGLIFGISLLVIFYLRIKAKAIDTKPAMIIAVLTGFIAPAFLGLYLFQEMGIFSGSVTTTDFLNTVMILAIFGAFSAVIFFVLTAVSDSVTRQYWPEKLRTWDLIRRGNFKNKPLGWVIIHAISIGGILLGVWAVVFSIMPSLSITPDLKLFSDTYLISPIASLLVSIFIVLLIVVTLFLIIGNQVIGLTRKPWLIPVISGLILAVLDVLPVSLSPWYLEATASFVMGFMLGYFYLKFDYLTIALAFFIFVNVLLSETGWVISNSPDINIFYLFLLILISLVAMGVYFIWEGTEREKLPEYVPAYIEDQAKEERVKQELSIARVVQETFLPSQIHQLPGIDMAGACIPAQETGGDYYDMISLGESRTAIAIGDVSGKGIRAAFYMTFTKGVLHSLSALILSPVELLNQLNRLFNENATRGTFISMIYGILEADKRQFTFARAGHNPMLVIRKNGDSEWIKPKGIGIGVAKDDSFIKCTEESILKLKEGDVVILYTDGVTEMLNSANQFYGEERLNRLVKGVRQASSAKILEIIIEDVNEFKGLTKQHDDMTLVIIKADASVNQ